jgi:hypothetical protein
MDEPVAWSYENKFNWDSWGEGTWQISISQNQEAAYQIPLYTAPPKKEWVELTNEEIKQLMPVCAEFASFRAGVRAVEAKLKEKNNG